MADEEFNLKPTRMLTHPHTTRSRLMLEVASALVNRKDFPYLQARVSLREQGAGEWPLTLFASDSPATIQEVADGRQPKKDNMLKNAPHTALTVTANDWTRPYSREQAAFPAPWVRTHKFWPSVSRIDEAYGDRHLICSCPPMDSY